MGSALAPVRVRAWTMAAHRYRSQLRLFAARGRRCMLKDRKISGKTLAKKGLLRVYWGQQRFTGSVNNYNSVIQRGEIEHMRIRAVITVIAGLCLWGAGLLFASPVGSVAGTVKDSTGAVVPNAKLTLTNSATNAEVTTLSNPEGEFQFLQLAPATYSLVGEASGFKKVTAPKIRTCAAHISTSTILESSAGWARNGRSKWITRAAPGTSLGCSSIRTSRP